MQTVHSLAPSETGTALYKMQDHVLDRKSNTLNNTSAYKSGSLEIFLQNSALNISVGPNILTGSLVTSFYFKSSSSFRGFSLRTTACSQVSPEVCSTLCSQPPLTTLSLSHLHPVPHLSGAVCVCGRGGTRSGALIHYRLSSHHRWK